MISPFSRFWSAPAAGETAAQTTNASQVDSDTSQEEQEEETCQITSSNSICTDEILFGTHCCHSPAMGAHGLVKPSRVPPRPRGLRAQSVGNGAESCRQISRPRRDHPGVDRDGHRGTATF